MTRRESGRRYKLGIFYEEKEDKWDKDQHEQGGG